ncbi:MAG: family 78 glycoside hydrolase catalytic domain [Clostridia bacterium]|nr:family 78 glycoside hydrolase catalytic domain [Clostridia bacterium]
MRKVFENSKWITFGRNKFEKRSVINPWEYPITPEIRNQDIPDGLGIPVFYKHFKIKKDIKNCIINITSLGCFNLYVNGSKVGNDELMPGWTDFNKRVLYYTYDLTGIITKGKNAVAVPVSLGWWAGRISLNTYKDNDIAFICEIKIEYEDGTIEYICSDTGWRGTTSGPVRYADIWDGEVYNANYDSYEEISTYDYPVSRVWKKPFEFKGFKGVISPMVGPTVKIRDFLDMKPVSATVYNGIVDNGSELGKINVIKQLDAENAPKNIVLKKGETVVYDMSQNMVGWAHFTVKGQKDTLVTLRHAEMLNDSGKFSRGNDGPDGSLYTANYRSAKAKAKYTLCGKENGEEYRPAFTFFGFRYVEITATEDIEILNFKCDVVGSDTKETGFIETSHKDINKLFSNVLWGQRGNYLSVPSDCPQRDETLGWTGDTQIFANTAAYNADVKGFFHKWLQDARDSQHESGAYTDVIPASRVITAGGAGWSDAGIIVPYVIYTMYGDTDIIKECYESMYDYMSWLSTKGYEGPTQRYGDWLAYEPTDRRFVSIAYYAYDSLLFSKMNKAISETEGDLYHRRSVEYMELYNKIKKHFQSIYVDENGKLTQDSQTAYLMALKFDLLPEECREKAIKVLDEKIKKNGYKLSTGFLGTGILTQTLSEVGLSNLAYSLLLQTEDPSWLYSVYQGATTVWERWNSYTLEKGFGDVGMNSFNHYAYGAVVEWMYKYMLGIVVDEDKPGFKHIILKPQPDLRTAEELPSGQENVRWARGEFDSVAGKITVSWNIEESSFTYNVSIPKNTTATLYMPVFDDQAATILVNGEVMPVSDFRKENGLLVIPIVPGEFEFITMR